MPVVQDHAGNLPSTASSSSLNAEHCVELHGHYSDVCGQDDIETFLFTSESVGMGHPGKTIISFVHGDLSFFGFLFSSFRNAKRALGLGFLIELFLVRTYLP